MLDVSNRWLEHNIGMFTPLEAEQPIRRFIDNLKRLFVHFANETKPVVENVGQRRWKHRDARNCETILFISLLIKQQSLNEIE